MQKQEIQIPELGAYFSNDHSNPQNYQKFERCASFGMRLFVDLTNYFFPLLSEELDLERSESKTLSFEVAGSSDIFKGCYYDPENGLLLAECEACYMFFNDRDGTAWYVRIKIFDEETSIFELEFYNQALARIRFLPKLQPRRDAIVAQIQNFFKANFVVAAD